MCVDDKIARGLTNKQLKLKLNCFVRMNYVITSLDFTEQKFFFFSELLNEPTLRSLFPLQL